MSVIETQGLTKRYGAVTAVENLSIRIEEGEIFGFLGPNGAGKSTTINMLLDFAKPTSGSARVFGMDCQENGKQIRRRIGVLPEGYDVYERLTGRQHLAFVRESKAAGDDVDAVFERVGLEPDAADRKTGGYSRGMKQRLVLGMALVGDPDLLILDEPSTGLDPNGARRMRQIVREEAEDGTTVFFSSHILSQVEAVCDRVAILQDGEVVATDTVEGLRSAVDVGSVLTVSLAAPVDGVAEAAERVDGVESARSDGATVTVTGAGDEKMAVLTAIEDAGGDVEDFSVEEASLDELFAAYTDRTGDEQ